MKGSAAVLVVVWLIVTPTPGGAAVTVDNHDAVEQLMLHTYVHGVNDGVVGDLLRESDVPLLLPLLRREGFPRKDNVVAFLAHADDGRAVDPLVGFLLDPMLSVDRPEDLRAAMLVPAALGHIARRTGGRGLSALLRFLKANDGRSLQQTAGVSRLHERLLPRLLDRAIWGLGLSGHPDAAARLIEIEANGGEFGVAERDYRDSAAAALALLATVQADSQLFNRRYANPVGASPGGPRESGPRAPDPWPFAASSELTFANHVDTASPIPNERVDSLVDLASLYVGRADYLENQAHDEDTACCVAFHRTGGAGAFGQAGDGLDEIDNEDEWRRVWMDDTARVKVVDGISWCSGPGTNIVGCGRTPGPTFAVVRLSDRAEESLLWAHEFGHNMGLHHPEPDDDSWRLMHWLLTPGRSRGLTAAECLQFHLPHADAEAVHVGQGFCRDSDRDDVHDSIDNCRLPNWAQADSDEDGIGNACVVSVPAVLRAKERSPAN